MKLIYTTFAAMLLAAIAGSQARADEVVNYFGVEGTTWLVETISTSTPEGLVSFGSLVMENPQKIQGRECMQISSVGDTENHPVGYIATEGEKVYFLDVNGEDWRLMYDFGLQPGESALIYGAATQYTMGAADAYIYEARCVSVETLEDSGLEMMHMDIYSTDEDSGDYPMVEDEVWIRGIGSTHGPYDNDMFAWAGVGSLLIKAESEGKVLYSREPLIPVAVKEGMVNSSVAEATYTVKGETANENPVLASSNLYPNPSFNGLFNLNVKAACKMEVISISGQLVMRQNMATPGAYTVDLSRFAPGVYYIRLSNREGSATLKAVRR